MDKQLVSMLVCPLCQGKLKYAREENELICTFDGLAYRVDDGVPVMLENEARRLSAEEKMERSASSQTVETSDQ